MRKETKNRSGFRVGPALDGFKKPKVSKQAGASHRHESKKELGTCFQKISFAPAGLAGPHSPRGHPGPFGSSCFSGPLVL